MLLHVLCRKSHSPSEGLREHPAAGPPVRPPCHLQQAAAVDPGENPGQTCLWSSFCGVEKGQHIFLCMVVETAPLYSFVLLANLQFSPSELRSGINSLPSCVPSSIEGNRILCDADREGAAGQLCDARLLKNARSNAGSCLSV